MCLAHQRNQPVNDVDTAFIPSDRAHLGDCGDQSSRHVISPIRINIQSAAMLAE